MLIVCVAHIAGASNTLSSISTTLSNVGSWTVATQFNGLVGGAGAYHVAAIAWAKITGAPGTGTVTANFTGGSGYTGEVAVLEIASGYHATPTGVTGTNSAASGTDFTVTASGSPASSSTMIGFLNSIVSGNTDNALTPDASYTELEEGQFYYATIGGSIEWQVVYDANSADSTCVFPRPSTGTCSAALVEFVESASSVTGTSATTNAAFTSTASGSTVRGTSATTNAAFTSTATGSTVTGSSATTNAAATSTASGTHSISGTSAQSLDAFTSSATGAHGVAGTSATTNAAATSTASGSSTTGTSATTNAAFTSTASGTHSISGTSATTFTDFTSTAAGSFGTDVTGAAAVTLSSFSSSASGSTVSGSVAATLSAYVSAAGGSSVAGAITQTLAAFTSTASGTFGAVADAHSATVTVYDQGHTATVHDRGHTASFRERTYAASIREQR